MDSVQHRAGKLLEAGVATNTRLAYTTGLNAFKNFRETYSLDLSWPTNEQHIVLFISYSFEIGRATSTIATYLAAINYFHKLHGWCDFQNSFITQKLLEGCRRSRPSKDNRAPVTKTVLLAICSVLPNVCYSPYEATLFHALFTLAYFGLFRVGELVSTNATSKSGLLVDDLRIERKTVSLVLRGYKTNQKRTPLTIKLPAEEEQAICPVLGSRKYVQNRVKSPGHLFCHANGTEVTRQQFASVLAKCLQKTVHAGGHYRTHSFRIGRATDLAALGMPNERIMQLGRWRSDCFRRYIRP